MSFLAGKDALEKDAASGGYSLVVVCWLPIALVSLAVAPRLEPGDLPNPGIKPVSPALAGGFFTTEPPRTLYRRTQKWKGSALKLHGARNNLL